MAAARSLRLRAAVWRLVRSGGVPGALVLVRREGRTLRLGAGLADRQARRRMHPADRFRIGSVTKTFIATLVLQLVQDGRMALGGCIDDWLPGLVRNGDAITVEQLLSHRSGVPDYIWDPALRLESLDARPRDWPPTELVAIAASREARCEPGERFGYSNTNYIILGLIVETVTGRTLAVELRQRLLDPLHLDDTDLPASATIAGHHARGYLADADGTLRDATVLSPSASWAAGGMVSTTADVARFLAALLGGEVLAASLLDAMEHVRQVGPRAGYGLGLVRLGGAPGAPQRAAWGHSGGMLGYLTFAYGSHDGARQLVVAINASVLPPRSRRALAGVLRAGGGAAGFSF